MLIGFIKKVIPNTNKLKWQGTKSNSQKKQCQNCPNICAYNSKNNLCRECWIIIQLDQYSLNTTINDFNTTASRHRYQGVRNHAHRVAKNLQLGQKCKICNYDTYVELCHIKAISSFDSNTKL